MNNEVILEPTTEAEVVSYAYFTYQCNVALSDNEKIIIEIGINEYDKKQGRYVLVPQKVQLEKLHYTVNDRCEVVLCSAVVRGFRKDGALKYRETYIPSQQIPKAISQIPDHYHDYARNSYPKELSELSDEVTITLQKGLHLS